MHHSPEIRIDTRCALCAMCVVPVILLRLNCANDILTMLIHTAATAAAEAAAVVATNANSVKVINYLARFSNRICVEKSHLQCSLAPADSSPHITQMTNYKFISDAS